MIVWPFGPVQVYFENLGRSYIVFCLETMENFKNYSTMSQII